MSSTGIWYAVGWVDIVEYEVAEVRGEGNKLLGRERGCRWEMMVLRSAQI